MTEEIGLSKNETIAQKDQLIKNLVEEIMMLRAELFILKQNKKYSLKRR